jgi:predicted kinase
MPRLILLAGPSGSGKSTYRKNLIATLPNAVAISSDDIIEEWGARDGLAYHEAYLAFSKDAKAEVQARLAVALEQGHDIIWDQTNLTSGIRRTAIEMMPHDYELLAVSFEAPLGLTLERVAERQRETGKFIPEEVVRTQHAGYERPHFDEGFDHVVVMHHPGGRAEVIS